MKLKLPFRFGKWLIGFLIYPFPLGYLIPRNVIRKIIDLSLR